MRIILASDHRGDEAGTRLAEHLTQLGHSVSIVGRCGNDSRDYPDEAWMVAKRVADGEADRGILLCSNGVGMCMAANKVPGVRASLVYETVHAERSRAHNDANVLCLGGETNSPEELNQIVESWLRTEFEGGRHARRTKKIEAIERGIDPATIDEDSSIGQPLG